MTSVNAATAARRLWPRGADQPVGCVMRAEGAVYEVMMDVGERRATLDAALLTRIAAGAEMPEPGDWVRLRWWPDDHWTIDSVISAPVAPVIPLRPLPSPRG